MCEVDCAGEFRHRPERQPARLGSSPDDVLQAARIALAGRPSEVPELTGDELAERRVVQRRDDPFSARYFPYGGADVEPQTGVASDWT